MTAAHCVDGVSSSRSQVRVGEHNQDSDEEAEHSRQRMFLDIKKEPYEEDHSSVIFIQLIQI